MKKKFNFGYVILIFLVAFNLRLGISSVPPIQNMIRESLNLTNLQVSLLTGIPVVCMGMFAFFVGKIQKIFGMKKSIFILLILLGLATVFRLFVNDYTLLLITTFCIGFSIAIIGPILSGFIKQEFSGYASILIGVYSFAMGVGSLIVSRLTKTVVVSFGNKWQYGLAIWGMITLLVGIIWLIYAPSEGESEHNNEKIKINFTDFSIWKMILFFGIQSGIFYGFSTWLIPFLESEGIKPERTIGLLTFYVAMQMFFGFMIPMIMHKVGTTKSWGTFSAVCIVIGCLLPIIMPVNLIVAIAIIILMAIGLGGSFPIAMIFPLEYARDPEEASIVTGIVQAFGYIFGGIIPVFFGFVVDKTKNFDNLFIQMFIGSVILLLIGMSKMKKSRK